MGKSRFERGNGPVVRHEEVNEFGAIFNPQTVGYVMLNTNFLHINMNYILCCIPKNHDLLYTFTKF